MNWWIIARKEFDDTVRSRVLWGFVAVVAVMVSLSMALPLLVPIFDADPVAGLGAASEFAAMLVPILSLVAAYLAIAGERESGSLRVLLALEPSRWTVVAGKFAGRAAVVVVGIVAGFGVAGVVGAVVYGGLPITAFLGVTALTAVLGVAFVGVAIGISAATATRSRAMTVGIATYLVFALLWDLIPQVLYLITTGAPPGGTVPGWFVFLQGVSPSGAYSVLVLEALHTIDPALPGIASSFSGPTPVYVQWWVFAALLLGWMVFPLLVGGTLFARADLD